MLSMSPMLALFWIIWKKQFSYVSHSYPNIIIIVSYGLVLIQFQCNGNQQNRVESSLKGVKCGLNSPLDMFVGIQCTEIDLFLIKMDYFYVLYLATV